MSDSEGRARHHRHRRHDDTDDLDDVEDSEEVERKKNKKHKKNRHEEEASDDNHKESKKKGSKADDDAEKPYEYDPDFKGYNPDRKCTDCCMLIFFIIFLCGMLAILFYALTRSNPKYLYIPTDYRNLLCGYDNSKLKVTNASLLPDLSNRPFLFWTRPGDKDYVRSFCVDKCPESGLFSDTFLANLNDENMTGGNFNESCAEQVSDGKTRRTVPGYSIPEGNVSYYCAYATKAVLRRCMPTNESLPDTNVNLTRFSKYFSQSLSAQTLLTAFSDVYNVKWWIAAFVGASLVLSFIWILLLRFTAAFFVWFTVLLCFAVSALLTVLCYAMKIDYFHTANKTEAYTFGVFSKDLNRKVFEVLFWICVAWDIIFTLVFLFLCDRIRLSVNIIKIVSKVFGQVLTLFIFPIFVYLIMFVWWIYVIGVAIVIYGAGEPKFIDDPKVGYKVEYKYDKVLQFLSIYHFFGFVWVSVFISDLGEMSLAGVFAAWYFNKDPRRKNMGRAPVLRSFWRSIRYHTGSLAFGSLIIAIVKVIRYIIEYIQLKTKDTQSTFVKWIVRCLICCFKCLEKFLKYINRNCYILIAIHGYNFFQGCKHAFELITRNIVRVITINWVGDFALFLGRVFVSGITTACSLYFFMKVTKEVEFYAIPSAVVFIFSFIVSGVFTELFEMGIDSMFLCFMEDSERNEGHEMCAPPELQAWIKKSEKPEEDSKSE